MELRCDSKRDLSYMVLSPFVKGQGIGEQRWHKRCRCQLFLFCFVLFFSFSGVSSSAIPVRSGVPHRTLLGPLIFLLYINDIIGENIKAQIGPFADDVVFLWHGIIKSVHDADSLQQDLNTLVHWDVTWQTSFNAKKCTTAKNLVLEIPNQIPKHHSWGTFGGCRTPQISWSLSLQ